MEKLEKYLKYSIIFLFFLCLYSCVFLFKSWIFPYITSKTIPFRIFVELMFLLYVVLMMYYPKYRPKKSIILYSLLIFTLILIVTSLFGINSHLSFAGDLERMWGINTWIHLVAFFIVISNIIRTKKDVSVFLYTLLVFSSYLAIYGYMQRMGVEGLFQTNITSGFQSFLGNSAYGAGVLMIGSLLSIFLFFKTDKIFSKIFAISCLLLQFPALVLSSIRGAQVGFIVSIFILLMFFLFTSKSKKVKIIFLVGIFSLFAFLSYIFINKDSNFIKQSPALSKLSMAFNFDKGTVRTRLISWSGGMKSFNDSPIIGLGMENYYYAFDKYFQADYYNIAATETWFDRAHNMFVEILACNGIFGILGYLFFIFSIIFALFKIYQADKENNSLFFIFFLGIIIAYFIQNAFVFDSLGVGVMFFTILALIEVYYTTYTDSEILFKKEFGYILKYLIIGLVSLLVFYMIFFINILHIKIAQQNNIVQKGIYMKDFDAVYADTKKLYSYNSYLNRDSTTMLIDSMMNNVQSANEQKKLDVYMSTIMLLNEKLSYYLSINPKDTYLQINLARLYLLVANLYEQGSPQNIDALNLAKRALEKCIELSQERLHCYYFMGQVEAGLRNKDAAISSFQKAVDLNPEYLMSSAYLGRAYQAFGEIDKGAQILNRVYELNPELKAQFQK